jgi:hypothetical protein
VFVKTVSNTNKDVRDIDIVLKNLFVFTSIKSNKKSNEKNGIRTIPINPK